MGVAKGIGIRVPDEADRKMMTTALRLLKRKYRKEMRTALDFHDGWELLVATMLSAQAQDRQVNKVTPALFRAFPSMNAYLGLKPEDLYPYTRSIGLYRNKSANIIKAANYIHSAFHGRLPNTISKMVEIPGVGRKTANVVLANAMGVNEGIAIDTHCITTSDRIFLLGTKDADKIEKFMVQVTPRADWGNVTHLLIALGRDVCTARAKHCERCVLRRICPSSTVRRQH